MKFKSIRNFKKHIDTHKVTSLDCNFMAYKWLALIHIGHSYDGDWNHAMNKGTQLFEYERHFPRLIAYLINGIRGKSSEHSLFAILIIFWILH